MTTALRPLASAALLAWLLALGGPGLSAQDRSDAGAYDVPSPTIHPPLPTAPDGFWLAPSTPSGSQSSALARAADLIDAGRAREARPLLRRRVDAPLTDYQRYLEASARHQLGQLSEAAALLDALLDRKPSGHLEERVRLLAGEIAEAQKAHASAAKHYQALTEAHPSSPDEVWSRVARARLAAGNRRGALEALAHLYFEFPFSGLAPAAAAEIAELSGWEPIEPGNQRYDLELGRAERLFGARRYANARDGFALLEPHARGDDAERVRLRLAECDHYLKRFRAARQALAPFTKEARRLAEARFFYLTATRALGEQAEYVRLARELGRDFPKESWAEETLNNLGTHYILVDDDAAAEAVFLELLERFPDGRHAPRASWKAGWAAYRTGRHDRAAAIFERAAAVFARSDYRPAWLYWAARSREKLGDLPAARHLFGIVIADYVNSYYGRLASRLLTARKLEPLTLASVVAPRRRDDREAAHAVDPSVASAVQALLSSGLYDLAIGEIQWGLRKSGDSAPLQATLAYAYARKGELRRGINAMKRAYPQYLSASGNDLPVEVREVLFPVAYWDLIAKYAKRRGLDPYLIAALMAQESTFDAAIRSPANAIGLMQIVPATGRRYGRRLGVRRYSTARLTDAEVNVIIGTAYFADLLERFGSVHLALAGYNAGPSAAARWAAERPGIDRDEFIDDIPYPETQGYVKKILGTAEDYRYLYGELGVPPVAGPPGSERRAAANASPRARRSGR